MMGKGFLGRHIDFPGGAVVKTPSANAGEARDLGSIPRSGRSPGEGNGNPTPVFLPGEFHGQRSLVGYSPWGHIELDATEYCTTHIDCLSATSLIYFPSNKFGC